MLPSGFGLIIHTSDIVTNLYGNSSDVNFTTDSGGGVVLDNEVFTFIGTNGIVTSGTGNTVTIDGSGVSGASDTNESTRVDRFAGFVCAGTDKAVGFYLNGSLVCAADVSGSGGNSTSDIQAVPVGGEVSGTVGNIVLNNDALDDQYYDSEADLTGLLDDNYADISVVDTDTWNTTAELDRDYLRLTDQRYNETSWVIAQSYLTSYTDTYNTTAELDRDYLRLTDQRFNESLTYPNLDTDVTDDFDGSWNSLSSVPSDFSDGVDNNTIYTSGNSNITISGSIITWVTPLFSGSWNDLSNVPVNIDTDSTDDLTLSVVVLSVGNWTADESGVRSSIETNRTAAEAYTDTVASSQDECGEISGCVVGAITDGNTGWDNSYGLFYSELNLTSLLDDNYAPISLTDTNETVRVSALENIKHQNGSSVKYTKANITTDLQVGIGYICTNSSGFIFTNTPC